MNLSQRIANGPDRLPSHVVPMNVTERRPVQKWWERARAGELYGTDANGEPIAKDMTGKVAA